MLRRLLVRRYWRRFFARGGVRTWTHEPTVRRAVNRRVTGSEDRWPIEWLADYLGGRRFGRAVSLGCGDGPLERDLMIKGLAETVLGLDLSPEALARAARRAREAGYDGLRYERADLDRLHLAPEAFDAVFAHQALHHVRRLESCIREIRGALVEGGLFYFDEYVGPARHEWSHELLAEAQSVYEELPRTVRRRRRLLLPVDWRDPSEAIRSSRIVPLTERAFEIEVRRDYGGNLLAVIHPHLDLESLGRTEADAILGHLIEREDAMLAAGAPSFYTVILARPRTAPASGA